MSKHRVFGASIVLLLASLSPALALDNVVIGDGRCDCMCETANAGNYGTYDSVGYGCGALNNKTCNIENPNTGLIETGRLWGCSPTSDNTQSTAPLNGVFEPITGDGPVIVRPGVVGPLQMFRQ